MKDNYLDPDIIPPMSNKEYNCRVITHNNSVYNIKSKIFGRSRSLNCYYIVWRGSFLILVSYAELDE